jgi:hypothetical protein
MEKNEELRERILEQIRWVGDRRVEAERNGNNRAEDVWYGYVKGLRWALSQTSSCLDLPKEDVAMALRSNE